MAMQRTEPAVPMKAPAVVAVAFMSLVVGSIWWQTREVEAEPDPAASLDSPVLAKAAAPKAARALSGEVRAFAEFARQDVPAESGRTRAVTADGMRLLAAAIAIRGDSVLWRDRAKRLEEAAVRVADAPDSTQAAAAAHEALSLAGEWVAGLPRVDSGAQALGAAAEAIAPQQPLSEQTEKVEAFFDAAASALEGSRT